MNTKAQQVYAGRPNTEHRDCAVRAFVVLTGKPYAEVHALFKSAGRKDGRGTRISVMRKVANSLNLKFVACNMTVSKFLSDVQYVPAVAAHIRGHAFGVIRGEIADFEPIKPRQIVKFYWVKQ
jgi:hypothetical protein